MSHVARRYNRPREQGTSTHLIITLDAQYPSQRKVVDSAVLLKVGGKEKSHGATCSIIALSEGEILHEEWVTNHASHQWIFDTLISCVLQDGDTPHNYTRPTSFTDFEHNSPASLEFSRLRNVF
jgi:hypothetical protein